MAPEARGMGATSSGARELSASRREGIEMGGSCHGTSVWHRVGK